MDTVIYVVLPLLVGAWGMRKVWRSYKVPERGDSRGVGWLMILGGFGFFLFTGFLAQLGAGFMHRRPYVRPEEMACVTATMEYFGVKRVSELRCTGAIMSFLRSVSGPDPTKRAAKLPDSAVAVEVPCNTGLDFDLTGKPPLERSPAVRDLTKLHRNCGYRFQCVAENDGKGHIATSIRTLEAFMYSNDQEQFDRCTTP